MSCVVLGGVVERGETAGAAMSQESAQSDPASFDAGEHAAFGAVLESANFEQFDLEMDEALQKLVGRWVHLAAPNADRIRRITADRQQRSKPAT